MHLLPSPPPSTGAEQQRIAPLSLTTTNATTNACIAPCNTHTDNVHHSLTTTNACIPPSATPTHGPPQQVLKARGVKEDKILFLSMIAAPQAIHRMCGSYPDMKVLTSEVDRGLDERYRIVPGVGEFGQRYFSD
jgi:hypothetical protein